MLKVLSIHIPKTAGTSFYAALTGAFGTENCIELKRKDMEDEAQKAKSLSAIAAEKRVIHGHLYYSEVESLVQQYDPKIICWIREPRERLLSDYHFFIKRLNDRLETQKEHHHLNQHRKTETFYTYASQAENKNVLSKYLEGANWENFFFIGEQEKYQSGLITLSEKLGKKLETDVRLNSFDNKTFEWEDLEPWLKEKIEDWNKPDLELYKRMKEYLART